MDLQEFLQEHDIKVWTSGKNVQAGWLNIQCIFCDDKSNHLGIRLKDLKANCWKCGKHYIDQIIQGICKCTLKQAKTIEKSIDIDNRYIEIKKDDIFKPNRVILPGSDIFPQAHLNYLKHRGFEPFQLIKKYNLKACHLDGEKYKFRIIIPIYKDSRLVSFTSRAIRDCSLPYLTAKSDESIITTKEIIFNFDSVKSHRDAFLVEGPFDVLKMGDGSFCFLGIKITQQRILEIAKKNIKTLFIFYDNDPKTKSGQKAAMKVSKLLRPIVQQLKILRFNTIKDPGDLTLKQVKELKQELRFD